MATGETEDRAVLLADREGQVEMQEAVTETEEMAAPAGRAEWALVAMAEAGETVPDLELAVTEDVGAMAPFRREGVVAAVPEVQEAISTAPAATVVMEEMVVLEVRAGTAAAVVRAAVHRAPVETAAMAGLQVAPAGQVGTEIHPEALVRADECCMI